jgi:hypothetical protein
MAASFGIEAAVIVSARSILQGAQEIAEGMAAAEQQAEIERRARRAQRQALRVAEREGATKLQRTIAERTAHLQRLHAVWQQLGQSEKQSVSAAQLPTSTAVADKATLTTHLAALDTQIDQLAAGLRELSLSLATDARADLELLIAAGVAAEQQLAAYLAQARLAGMTTALATAREGLVERVLERLASAADEPLPPALEALTREVIEAPTEARAAALASELRYQVQQHNEVRAAAVEEARRQEAAAVVLEQSLKDLGYAIEEIEETLFVEGGIAHFQRPEWGDYFIRLRIDPQRKAMNFNVVRAGTADEDRKREDMHAEERWCSEYPRLFETLKARGIPIQVTRLLQAGEAPVQVVDAASLPQRQEQEQRRSTLQAQQIT